MALWPDIMVAYRRFDQINLPTMVFPHCKRFSRATLTLPLFSLMHTCKERIFVHLIYRVREIEGTFFFVYSDCFWLHVWAYLLCEIRVLFGPFIFPHIGLLETLTQTHLYGLSLSCFPNPFQWNQTKFKYLVLTFVCMCKYVVWIFVRLTFHAWIYCHLYNVQSCFCMSITFYCVIEKANSK